MYCYLNDNFIDDKTATISIFDRSFKYGENIFETMVLREGNIIELEFHLKRLFESAKSIFINIHKTKLEINNIIQKLVIKNKIKNAIIRIMITRGNSLKGLGFDSTEKPLLLISEIEFNGYAENLYSNGLSSQIVKIKKIPKDSLNPNIKAGAAYLVNILAKHEAKIKKADEAIFLNMDNYITECTTSNIFWIKDDIVYTPSLDCGIFPGITRQIVIKLIKKLRLEIKEGKYKKETLLNADEVFLSYTSAGIMPVTKINGETIGGCKIGRVSKNILKKFWEYYKIENPYCR